MNELLGWYGYDKVSSRDTQGLNLHHFASPPSPSRHDSDTSSDDDDTANSPANSPPPGKQVQGASQGILAGLYLFGWKSGSINKLYLGKAKW